jgi:serine/threonine protein kinase
VPPIGAVVAGKYRIEAEIGRGGMGVVYRATLVTAGAPVALKMLLPDGADAEGRARFAREMQLASRLNHPNTVRVLDAGYAEDGAPYLCCELLHGRTLSAAIKAEGALPVERVVRIGMQVLDALTEAHALGIVHRDIKPANVFLCHEPPDFVKVLDFGVAKRPDSHTHAPLTAAGIGIGTPQYMAPEQVGGLTVGPGTDLYALGLVLAEALTGQMVVRGSSLQEIFIAQASPIAVALPPAVLASPIGPVVARAIEKEPASRFPSARDMRVALDHQTGGTLRSPVGPQPARSGLTWVVIIIAALAAFGVAAAAVVVARASAEPTASKKKKNDETDEEAPSGKKKKTTKKKPTGPSRGKLEAKLNKLTPARIEAVLASEGYPSKNASPTTSAGVWNFTKGELFVAVQFFDNDPLSASFEAESCDEDDSTYAVDVGRVLCVNFDPDEGGERELFDALVRAGK